MVGLLMALIEIDGPYLDEKKMGGSGPMANCFSCPKVARNDGEPVDLGLWHKNDPKCQEMVEVVLQSYIEKNSRNGS